MQLPRLVGHRSLLAVQRCQEHFKLNNVELSITMFTMNAVRCKTDCPRQRVLVRQGRACSCWSAAACWWSKPRRLRHQERHLSAIAALWSGCSCNCAYSFICSLCSCTATTNSLQKKKSDLTMKSPLSTNMPPSESNKDNTECTSHTTAV
jgi:hypothetical protein